jgi:ligand-binding SRPBCC domain-containing protein
MKIHTLVREQVVATPHDEVFAFFAQPENLARLTPAALRFRILTPTPFEMKEGALIDYVIHPMGIPMRWRTLITTYDPPHRFIDEQLLGPYSFWHHTHTFTETADGTMLGDRVVYSLPLGPVGTLVHALVIQRQLRRIFAYRSRVIAEMFGDVVTNVSDH